MNPEVVETDSLGTLEFRDGKPVPGTVEKVYDNLDLILIDLLYLSLIYIDQMANLRLY